MSLLGVYFGPKTINIVMTQGKKALHNIQIPHSTAFQRELEEKVPAEVKDLEIVALFKDELRKNKIEAKEAVVCLSGRDLIIRTFEMPPLPRQELESAISFEVKKYIPFKAEELVSDFQVEFDNQSRTNLVLFVGIKKEVLERYVSIFNQLETKLKTIEYSAFSVLRYLTLSNSGESGIIGVLAADLKNEDEANFTVLDNGFPLFSRDIALTMESGGLADTEAAGPAALLEKLKTEIRVSLDYYQRKSPAKKIKKLLLFLNQDYRQDLEAFIAESGLPVKFIDTAAYIDKTLPYSLGFLKGYSASLPPAIKTKPKINLAAIAAEKPRPLERINIQKEAASLFKEFRLDYRVAALGLLICLAAAGAGFYRVQLLRKEIKNTAKVRPAVATVNPQASYEELAEKDSEYKNKLATLDGLIRDQLYLTDPLSALPRILPQGAWLTNFSFGEQEDIGVALNLEGAVYLANPDEEFKAANKFLSDLKANAAFAKYFKEIGIVSLDREQMDDKFTATKFSISCKTEIQQQQYGVSRGRRRN